MKLVYTLPPPYPLLFTAYGLTVSLFTWSLLVCCAFIYHGLCNISSSWDLHNLRGRDEEEEEGGKGGRGGMEEGQEGRGGRGGMKGDKRGRGGRWGMEGEKRGMIKEPMKERGKGGGGGKNEGGWICRRKGVSWVDS